MKNLGRAEIIQIIIDTLAPLGVSRIALFGSFARGEDNSDSDIDILVRLPSPGKRKLIGLRWFSLDQEIQDKIGRKVDLVTEDSLLSTIRVRIQKDLRVIYEKAG